MGLLDSIIGMATGKGGGLRNLLPLLLDNDGPAGGIGGLLSKFNEQGMGDIASSWIGSGENLPISGEKLKSILGDDLMATAAEKLGVDSSEAADQLSSALPDVVNQLTPEGEMPDGGFDAGDLMNIVGKLFK